MHSWVNRFRAKRQKGQWFPIFIIRIALGLFFILSGFFKVFDGKHHEALVNTLKKTSIPWPEFYSYFFPLIECAGGILILIGYFTSIASLVLFLLMILALITGRAAHVAQHGGIMALENFLYLPEVLYALLFFWLIFSGPGKISLDAHRAKKSITLP